MTVPNYIWLLLALLAAATLGCAVYAVVKTVETRRLRTAAFLDPSTGALTEAGFREGAEKVLAAEGDKYTLVVLCAGCFATLRASFGPREAERFMAYLHTVLRRCLSGSELCGRVGDDELAFLLKNRNADEVRARLSRMTEEAEKGVRATGAEYALHLSFGACHGEKGETDTVTLLGRARLSRMTSQAGQRYHFYDAALTERLAREAEVAQAMDKALALGEFVLFYQPKVRLRDGRVMGAEAMVRWRHPQKGLLSPDMFMATAEKYQKLKAIDRFAITSVCRALSRWEKQGRELCPISVNLSSSNMNDPDFADECSEICRSFGVKPESIGFEINEGVLLQDPARAVAFTRRLRSKGFRFIVDEFGAAASALRLLSDLRPDEVKLSRTFFADETDTRDGRFMVENLLRLCAQLHVSGVAQGVDSAAQAEYLMDAACDMVQGFSFFKPMALERFETEVFHGSALRLVDLPRSEKKPLTRLGGETANAPIVHFAFLSLEDRVEFDSAFSPILAGATSIDGARSLFRTSELIHENDRADFLLLLDRAQKEKGWLESTIRFYTNHSGYEWLQLRLHCADQRSGVISGTMVNVAGWIGEVDRWKEKATRDALTGLFNREHFERTLRAGVEGNALASAALVFIDVDDFKNVNDSYGHMFGDDVLCYVAKRILGTFRHSDVCARYGGDEFVIFAPGISRDVLTERLEALCAAFTFPYRNGETECKISISVGGAMFPTDGGDYASLLDRADSALYEAKNAGKDRYMLYDKSMEANAGKRRRDED